MFSRKCFVMHPNQHDARDTIEAFMKTPSIKSLGAALGVALVLPLSDAQGAAATPPPAAPEMQQVLDQLAKLNPKPLETLSATEARKQPSPADAVKRIALKPGAPSPRPEPVEKIDDYGIPGAAGEIKVRVYTPKGSGPFPVIVYFHGGGWVIADLDTYDASPRALANAANAVILSAHYRQGPEHKFPAAHQDAFAAYKWALENLKKLNGQPGKIAVSGESAGGNLATAVCLMAREQNVALPVHQLLIYPVTNFAFDTPSYQENAMAKPLGKAGMQWFFSQAATPADAENPFLSPLRAKDLRGMPPATIITAQIDPLRSEGEAYAKKLQAAGVKTNYRNFDAVTHEFFGMGSVVPQAKEAVQLAAQDLRASFGNAAKP